MRVGSMLILLLLPVATTARDVLPKTPQEFELNGHTAYFYAAPKPAKGKPWVWYFPTLKAIPLVIRRAYFEGFLNAGIGIAGYDQDVKGIVKRFDKDGDGRLDAAEIAEALKALRKR